MNKETQTEDGGLSRRIGCVVPFFLLLFLFAFSWYNSTSDFARKIRNEYILYSVNPYDTGLLRIVSSGPPIDEARQVVPAIITKIAWQGDYVYGYTTKNLPPDHADNQYCPFPGEPAPVDGYFIVKMSSNNVSLGLGKEEWKTRLKAAGIEDPQDLWIPRRKFGGWSHVLWKLITGEKDPSWARRWCSETGKED